MRIVIFSHSAETYGAELALFEMIETLKNDHEFIIFLPKEGLLADKLRKINIRVEILKYKWWVHSSKDKIFKYFARIILNFISSIIATYKVQKYKPDLIISNTAVINIGMITSILLKKPHIWFIHEFVKEDHKLTYDLGEKLSMKLMNKYSTFIIVVSNKIKQKYKVFIDEKKIKLIYLQNIKKPLIEDKSFWPLESDIEYLKLVITGSISESKGQILAIKSLYELKNDGINKIQLIIIGSGNEKYIQDLKKKVLEYKLEKQVIFLGYINNPYPIIMAADSSLMLSDFEAFGRVSIESMMCGKMIISSNSGSADEIVQDNKNGLLFKPKSSHDLALKIKYIYNNRSLIAEMGQEAKKFSDKFNNPKKYKMELNELINESVK